MELTDTCGSCRAALPVRARFCPACGTPVTAAPDPGGLDQAIEEALGTELRHLTVVFCDLVGSTELSATTDLEEYSDLIRSYQDEAVSIGRRYGGDVEGYSGDGILFRFGWPQAHDDDAVQAVQAALDIIAAVTVLDDDRRLAMRIGVHSGPAVVGELGGADRRATMAVGETLNVAARLQGAAEPGTVVASGDTVAQIAGRFDVTPLGALDLRGVPTPVDAYRVDGRPGGGARPAMFSRRTSIVGRDAELARLQSAWDQVRGGHGCAVLVTGEPG
ncbi:MAG TPA: adenylate/guanylate cyclase domain-containing protein, partial [Acidimicrobiales bacterium]